MKSASLILLCFSLAGTGRAQTPAPSEQGLTAEWDVKTLLDALSKQAGRLNPILDRLKPQEWVAKGAPQGYVTQWKTAKDELKYLLGSAQNLEKQPERLTLALETYFRMQALDSTLDSLTDGIRKYHNPAVADLLKGMMTENSNNREKLRLYIVDLATTQEQQYKVVDEEAQRCRGILGRQAPATPTTTSPRK
ncbi:MAG TPA: hypothetical protein VKV15_17625 [Bryobacteraceae bacterium]|nr:hypothetical protein [Bryobacteraceae bacterium]